MLLSYRTPLFRRFPKALLSLIVLCSLPIFLLLNLISDTRPDVSPLDENKITSIGDIDTIIQHKPVFNDKEFVITKADGLLFVDRDPADFVQLGKQLRTFRKLFSNLERVKNAYGSHFITPQNVNKHVFLSYVKQYKKVEKRLFPWMNPLYGSLFELKDSYSGRGIVLGVNNRYVGFALATIHAIRELHKSDIPIEIFYLSEGDLSAENIITLEKIKNVICKDITKLLDDSILQLGGWAIKPFALLVSSCTECILMDADVELLSPPEVFFDQPNYKKHSVLFFHDRTMFSSDPKTVDWISSIIEKPHSQFIANSRFMNGKTAHEQESGIVVINKKKRFLGLLSTCSMNNKEERDLVSYKKFHGDKETFWTGFELIHEPYSFSPHYPGTLGVFDEEKQELCSTQMTHFSDDRQPLWFNNGIVVNKFDKASPVAEMTHWMSEPGKWTLHQNNRACLSSATQPVLLSEEQKETISKLGVIWKTYNS